MNIQILSDIHTEFHMDLGRGFIETLDPTDVDVLVVAGDVAAGTSLDSSLRGLCKKYPHVVYTPGNHEYYHSSWERIEVLLHQIAAKYPNFHLLLDSTATIDGQRFIGCPMWFPDDPTLEKYRRNLSDFHYIEGFYPEVILRNRKSVQYLSDNIQAGDVVVTHHIPTPKGNDPRFANSTLNIFFTCDVEDIIMEKSPALWVFGHTHHSSDFPLGNTRLVSNPLGYIRGPGLTMPENPHFDWKKIVTLSKQVA